MLRLNWLAIDCRPYSTHQYFFYAVILFQSFVVFLVLNVWKVENIGEKESQCINWMFPAFIMDPKCCFHVPFWSPLTNKVSVKRNALLNFSFIFFPNSFDSSYNQPANEQTNEKKNRKLFVENFNGMPNNKSSLHEFDTVRLFDSHSIYKWFAHEWEN